VKQDYNDRSHSTFEKVFAIQPNEKKLFYFGVLISLVSKGQALFNSSYSVDDIWFRHIRYNFETVGVTSFREGRFTGPFLAGLEDALGTNLAHATTLSALTMMICMTVTAIMICRLWRTTSDFGLSAIIVAILLLHPYQTDFYTWKMSMFNGSLAFPIALGALLLARKSWQFFLPAVLSLVVALGIQQIPLQFNATALMLTIPFMFPYEEKQYREWLRMFLLIAIATILYWILAHYVIKVFGAIHGTLGRDKIIIFNEPWLVWLRIKELCSLFVFKDPLVSPLTRILLCLLVFAVIFGLCLPWRENFSSGWKRVAVLSLTGIVSILASIILTIAPMAWMPVFRNMFSISLLWASLAGLAYSLSRGNLRKFVVLSVALISFGFIGKDNEILDDQIRSNARDWSMMTRIAADVEHLSDFPSIARILFIGTNPAPIQKLSSGADLSNGWHAYGVTLSAFAVPWPEYLNQLYMDVTGYLYMGYATEMERTQAGQKCSNLKWPDHDAVYRTGELAVVCLGRPVQVIKNELSN